MTKTGAKRKSNLISPNPVQDIFALDAAIVNESPASENHVEHASPPPASHPECTAVHGSASPATGSIVAVASSPPASQPSALGPRTKFLKLMDPQITVQPERPHDECHAGCDVPGWGCPEVREGVTAGAAASAVMIAAHGRVDVYFE